MPRRLFRFDAPDRFVSGTLGSPGDRTFYLQARQGAAIVTLLVEKAQVAALAERLTDLTEALGHAEQAPVSGSWVLDEPLVEAFRVGAMALAWDGDRDQVVIEAQPISEDGGYVEAGDDDPEGPDLFRVRLGPADARRFALHAAELVQAGRPSCPFCGQPIDERGHLCARTNASLN